MADSASQPLAASERYFALDVLRGVAVLGILLMNIGSFAMPDAAYLNPYAYGDLRGANGWVYRLTHIFASGKFISIFAMLFGAGIVLRDDRGSATITHVRRLLVLLAIGTLHAYLIWHGDILFTYAVLGLVVLLCRHWRPTALLFAGIGLYVAGLLVNLALAVGLMMASAEARQASIEGLAPNVAQVAAELAAFRGSWLQQMPLRSDFAFFGQTTVLLLYDCRTWAA